MNAIALLSAGALFGGMLFFTAVFAPLVFAHLDKEVAADLIRAVFPWYYLFVVATAVVGALALAPGGAWQGWVLAAVAGIALAARQALLPAIVAAREAGSHRRFRALHRVSVAINIVQLATAAIALAGLA
ncbi:MAG: DUF4149 domain-containing protein [Alphaproteobacteria bacterium]